MPPDSSKGNIGQHRASQRSFECISVYSNQYFIHVLGVDIDNIDNIHQIDDYLMFADIEAREPEARSK